VAVGLRGNDAPMNRRQQSLPFGQSQPSLACSLTQIGDIAKSVRPATSIASKLED